MSKWHTFFCALGAGLAAAGAAVTGPVGIALVTIGAFMSGLSLPQPKGTTPATPAK